MASNSSMQDAASLPPEFLAADIHLNLLRTSQAFIILTTVVYILFNISRICCVDRNGLETWWLYPISYVFQVSLGILGILFVEYGGAGRHIQYWILHDPGIGSKYLKIQTATEFIYVAGVTFPKVCILLLYLNIFVERKVRIATQVAIAVVVTHWIVIGIIVPFTLCQPFAYKWDKSIPDGHCADITAAYRWVSVPNIVTDLVIIILPVPTLYHLQTTRSRKIGIGLTFLTGGLGIIAAIVRFVGFFTVNTELDATYLGVNPQIYTLVEPNAYFICSCLPGMRPLVYWVLNNAGLASIIHKRYRRLTSGSNAMNYERSDIP